jgi:hypothetical protein
VSPDFAQLFIILTGVAVMVSIILGLELWGK